MYASASRSGLGIVASCDPFGNAGLVPGDPGYDVSLVYDDATGCWVQTGGDYSSAIPNISLTPGVIQTQYPVTIPLAPLPPVAPLTITPTDLPVTLPALVTTAPAPIVPSNTLLYGLLAYGAYRLLQSMRGR